MTIQEGDSGTKSMQFRISLSEVATQTVTVRYRTLNTSNIIKPAGTDIARSANPNRDFNPVSSGTISFAPGETSKYITITTYGDTLVEKDEVFWVELYSVIGGKLNNWGGLSSQSDRFGLGTIRNDDTYPSMTISDVQKAEGDSGLTPFAFTVRLSKSYVEPVTVEYRTQDGSALVADGDYNALSIRTLTFSPGQRSKTITVYVRGDTKVEPNETFNVKLSNPTRVTLSDDTGIGTILNDDTAQMDITDVNLTEGDFGLKPFDFNITLDRVHYEQIQVRYSVEDGTAKKSGNDYKDTSGIITFAPGEREKNVTVNVVGDLYIEPNETFKVRLSFVGNPPSITMNRTEANGTILNDDSGFRASEINMNVERINSGSDPINSAQRNAWYTQITGRAFNYDVRSYDKAMQHEYNLRNVVVKVVLFDDTGAAGTQVPIDTRYAYFPTAPSSKQRVSNVLINEASKDARFYIFVPTFGDIIVKQDCSGKSARDCYEGLVGSSGSIDDSLLNGGSVGETRIASRDNFAIRPAGYYYQIKHTGDDPIVLNTTERSNSRYLAAGLTHNLLVKALPYGGNSNSPEIRSYQDIAAARILKADMSGLHCQDTADKQDTVAFVEGTANDTGFMLEQVGKYRLQFRDSNWTVVDRNSTQDCIVGSNAISAHGYERSGCDISSEFTLGSTEYHDAELVFVPHHFSVDLTGGTRPADMEVVYMHDITKSREMSARVDMVVTAKSGNILQDTNLTNFTDGCMADQLSFSVDLNTTPALDMLKDSDDQPHKLLLSQDDAAPKDIDHNLTTGYTVAKSKFEYAKRGSADVKLNYNITRSELAAMNPVSSVLNRIHVTSERTPYYTSPNQTVVPDGNSTISVPHTFLYARARATQKLYEGLRSEGSVDTALAIDVYCLDVAGDGCDDSNGDPKYGIRTSESSMGWWLATRYIETNYAARLSLKNSNNIEGVTILPDDIFAIPKNPDYSDENSSANALREQIEVGCPANEEDIADIRLTDSSSAWLIYDNDPLYRVKCSDSSNWAGLGRESNVLDGAKRSISGAGGNEKSNPNSAPEASGLRKTHRMSW